MVSFLISWSDKSQPTVDLEEVKAQTQLLNKERELQADGIATAKALRQDHV